MFGVIVKRLDGTTLLDLAQQLGITSTGVKHIESEALSHLIAGGFGFELLCWSKGTIELREVWRRLSQDAKEQIFSDVLCICDEGEVAEFIEEHSVKERPAIPQEEIAAALDRCGVSQRMMAAWLGVDPRTIGRYRKGLYTDSVACLRLRQYLHHLLRMRESIEQLRDGLGDLRQARMEAGMTQEDLALAAGVSQSVVNRIELGKSSSVRVMDLIVSALAYARCGHERPREGFKG